jgi:hypothetical protein
MTQTDTIDWTRWNDGLNVDGVDEAYKFEVALDTIPSMSGRWSCLPHTGDSLYYEFSFYTSADLDTTTVCLRVSNHGVGCGHNYGQYDYRWSVDPTGLRMAAAIERLAQLAESSAAFEAAIWGA